MSRGERILSLILIASAVIGFLGTVSILNARFSFLAPAKGGTLHEGIIGNPHFVNPLLAISDTDRDLVSLVFSGLMRPDGQGNLIPDLAERYEVSEDRLSYTFYLKNDAFFHDQKELKADDIVFTVALAKNPNLKSPLRASWEGVETEKVNDRTVRFWLKRPYAQFLENTTLGILPEHIWKSIDPEQISLAKANLRPVGSGPYKVQNVAINANDVIESYTLESFSDFISGKPFVQKIVTHFYPSEDELLKAHDKGAIDSFGAISPKNVSKIKKNNVVLKSLTLPRIFAVFFNQNEKKLFTDKAVREALNLAADKDKIVKEVLEGHGVAISSPLPPGTLGAISVTSTEYNIEKARAILEKNGWIKNSETGIYEKIEKKKVVETLSFSLATSNWPDLIRAADILRASWEELGAKVEVKVFEIGDLNQNVISPRKYDALLFGEVVGRDPDPFAFWHSSQRNNPGLNIALYTSAKVDKILETARTLSSAEDREKEYAEFQEEIQADLPAIFLYSPYYLYVVPNNLKGFSTEHITVPSERFSGVNKWHFDTIYIWKIFKRFIPNY
ncbi:hypothetical protein HYW53_03225 [Candidatus Giovannonibacteria bacterium]|nr:hypothetical protein [Candidatus Giovannonibacteria bacterium]